MIELGVTWRGRGRALLAVAGAAGACVAAGLPMPAVAQPVVQALPDPAAGDLRDALLALSSQPHSLEHLVAAGRASITLGNIDSAIDFYRRAEAVSPNDRRVKAGLATIALRQQRPADALRLFAEAEAAGENMIPHAYDRGLAFDLMGDNASAQRVYAQALAGNDNPELARRMALSQAISGDKAAAEATLLPMLQQGDLASFRTRAFALAILGEEEEAVTIAQTLLPAAASGRLAPYLRYMPRLTRAQQAAAANLGVFPPAGEIGRDRAEVAAFTPPPAAGPAEVDSRLIPAGPALGAPAPAPAQVERTPRRITVAARRPAPLMLRPPPPPVRQPAAAPLPSFAVQELPAAPPAPAQPSPAVQGPPVSEDIDLVSAFADFATVASPPAGPVAGAVDLTSFQPVREAPPPPPAPAEPPPPEHPSRHWVQVATGRDTAAFAFDWRRIRRQAEGLLDDAEPHFAAWGQTNRLLAGPYPNAREANELVEKLKEGGVDSFRFTSARGEEVAELD